MPRKPGTLGRKTSFVRAIRLPNDLDEAVIAACGGANKFAEWARNAFRHAVNIPLDYSVGYKEGRAAGWAASSADFQTASESQPKR